MKVEEDDNRHREENTGHRDACSVFTDESGQTCDKRILLRIAENQWLTSRQAGDTVPEWIEVLDPKTGVCAYYSHSKQMLRTEKPTGWVHMVCKQFQQGQTTLRGRVTSDFLLEIGGRAESN